MVHGRSAASFAVHRRPPPPSARVCGGSEGSGGGGGLVVEGAGERITESRSKQNHGEGCDEGTGGFRRGNLGKSETTRGVARKVSTSLSWKGVKVVGPPDGLGFRRNSRRERAREARAPGLDSSESGAHLPRGSDVVGPGFSPLTLAGPDHRRAHFELPSVFHFALRLRVFFLRSFPVA